MSEVYLNSVRDAADAEELVRQICALVEAND
ncbi:unnamed protein product, partial [Gongylonema pulchrum]|uniref:DUF1330 domain-containing protein n=1 Tax=Gongylonema pulchrum TaxID=637853 RepID=A0A183EGG7_9BILA